MKFWRLNHPLLIASLLCLFVSSASLALLLSLDRIIDWKISQTVKLRNGSAVFDAWKSTRSPSKVAIYMYNLTNPEETLQGQAPHLKAIGPYVYWEKEDKVNVSWTEVDGIRGLRYFKRSLYTFDAALSVGDPEKDKIITVSLPILALSAAIKAGRDPTMGFLGLLRLLYNLELFTTQTVHGYLWGYEDPLLDLCSACDTKKVGLLHKSNNTLRGPYIIDAGLENSSNTGQLLSVEKKRQLDIWSTKEANTIKGTDGSRLPRGLRLGDLKEVFVPMLCRPLKMTAKGFTHPSLYDQLKVLEFQPDASTFNGSHETYCPITVSGPPCPPAGLFDISQCSLPGQISPPIYASMPHFLHGHADLRAPFKGLRKANPRIDTVKLLVEPKTGISVEAQLRLQINAYIERTPDLADVFLNVTDRVYLPIAWFEKNEGGSVDKLEVLHHSLEIQPEQIRQILYIVFFCNAAFFVLFAIGSVVVPCEMRYRILRWFNGLRDRTKEGTSMRHLFGDISEDSSEILPETKGSKNVIRGTL